MELAGRRLRPDLVPRYAPPMQVRVVAGPEAHRFTEESVRGLLHDRVEAQPEGGPDGDALHRA